MLISFTGEGVEGADFPKWLVNTNALKESIEIIITVYYKGVSTAGAVGQMNSGWAAWAEETVASDCGESAAAMDF